MNAVLPHAGPLGLTPTGWDLAGEMSFNEWRELGRRFAAVGRALPWLIGDWVNFGEGAYGEKYSEAAEVTGLEHGTLMNYAYVASRFPISRRRETLSWSHHYEVAGLEREEADWLLDRAEQFGWSQKRFRNEVRARREVASSSASDTAISQSPPVRSTIAVELTSPAASGAESRRQLALRIQRLTEQAAKLGLRVVAEA